MKERNATIKRLLTEQLDQAYAAAEEAGCFASKAGERRFPNTLEGDRATRDAGSLCERGLGAFLDGDPLPQPNSDMMLDLIARAAADYGIDFTESDRWAAAGAERIPILALALIRDFRRDLYELEPPARWPTYKKRWLARHADFVRSRDGLSTDREALGVLLHWPQYRGESIHRMVKYLNESRRLGGSGRGRGRPRKLAADAKK